MISITNSLETITICKVESIEIDMFNYELIINGYVMEKPSKPLHTLDDKEKNERIINLNSLRYKILDILHNKMKGRYIINKDLKLVKEGEDK